jgi:hypothetical protein
MRAFVAGESLRFRRMSVAHERRATYFRRDLRRTRPEIICLSRVILLLTRIGDHVSSTPARITTMN